MTDQDPEPTEDEADTGAPPSEGSDDSQYEPKDDSRYSMETGI